MYFFIFNVYWFSAQVKMDIIRVIQFHILPGHLSLPRQICHALLPVGVLSAKIHLTLSNDLPPPCHLIALRLSSTFIDHYELTLCTICVQGYVQHYGLVVLLHAFLFALVYGLHY